MHRSYKSTTFFNKLNYVRYKMQHNGKIEDWREFIKRTNRLPALQEVWRRSDGSEWKIGRWYQNMRRNYSKGLVERHYAEMLGDLPGWRWVVDDNELLELCRKQSYIALRAASRRNRLWLPDEIWKQLIIPLIKIDK